MPVLNDPPAGADTARPTQATHASPGIVPRPLEPVDASTPTSTDETPVETRLVRSVRWQDLLAPSRVQIVHELLISLPWLLASWYAADRRLYPVALACSFMFFLTGLRQVHGAYHYSLGISRAATEWSMVVMSALMLGSMHAVQINHLRHHRYCMGPQDVEAASARLSWWRAIAVGPLFPLRLLRTAMQVGTQRLRGWIALELVVNVAWIALVFCCFHVECLKYHVLTMAVGQCLTSFFAVWTVHHDAPHSPSMSRTVRGAIRARITYNMFFHMEHHLFPAVPTCHLDTLARRIDAAAPGLPLKLVF